MSNVIEIWQPKYSTNECLIAKYKVKKGDNFIKFTKAKHLEGMLFSVNGSDVMKSPIVTNGKIECYAVPMDKLKRVD